MRIDSYVDLLCSGLRYTSERAKERLRLLESGCSAESYLKYIGEKRDAVKDILENASHIVSELTLEQRRALALKCEKLNALNPLSVLSRGYSVVTKDGVGIGSKGKLSAGDRVTIRFSDGCADAVIE